MTDVSNTESVALKPRNSVGPISRRTIMQVAAVGAVAAATGSISTRDASASQPRQSGVAVYPMHGTNTASPYTEISFRGITEELLGLVIVEGSRSGPHSGIFMPHADGNGVSFVPDSRFTEGEAVFVNAGTSLKGASDGSVKFIVAETAPLLRSRTSRELEDALSQSAGAEDVQDVGEDAIATYRSRPDIEVPTFKITTQSPNTAPGLIFLGSRVPDLDAGAMIIDEDGELVWFVPEYQPDYVINNVRPQEYLGEQVLTFTEAAGPIGHGLGHNDVYNNAYERVAQVRAANGFPGVDLHEFQLTPRGTAYLLLYTPVYWDLTQVGGSERGAVLDNIIQEVEIETGRVLFEWHSLDHIAVEESYREFSSNPDSATDYLHVNSLDETEDGNLVLCGRHTNAIYRIDRTSGAIRWRLNGKNSDFEMAEGAEFAWQHDARLHPNGELSLFDNVEAERDSTKVSQGLVLDLNTETMTASVVQEYVHPDGILSNSQGNMQRLPNSNVFIGWGSSPEFSEMSRDGELLYSGRFQAGGTSYRAFRFPWVGRPSTPPDIAAERNLFQTDVYASWNGATEVATWEVLAGSSPDQLQSVGSAPKGGFETMITVQTNEAYVAARALDEAGNVLGTTATVEPAS